MTGISGFGTLVADCRTFAQGVSVRVADNNPLNKDREGNKQAIFLNLTMWGKMAENLTPYLVKGAKIAYTGTLTSDYYEKDGVKLPSVQVNVSSAELVRNTAEQGENKTPAAPPSQYGANPTSDEIPF